MPAICDFDRYRDLLLHLFGCAARPLGNHLDVVVGYVGIRLHREIMERDGAPDEQQNGQRQDHEPVVKCKINQTTNHYWSTVFCSSSALVTTCCPGARPEMTSCLPSRNHCAADDPHPLELSCAGRHIDPVPIMQMKNRGGRYGGVVLEFAAVEGGRGKHADAHQAVRIRHLDTNLRGADTGIKHGVDLSDGAGDHMVWVGGQPDVSSLANVNHGQIVFVDIANDPHLREVGDGKSRGGARVGDARSGSVGDVLRDHYTGCRRINFRG